MMMPVVRRLTLAVCLLSCGLFTPPVHAHDGAKFEPPDGTVLHGAGQHQQAYDDYTAALGDPALQPFITKDYIAVWDRWPMQWLNGAITWAQLQTLYFDPLRDWLDDQRGLMPEISVGYAKYMGVFGDQVIPTGVLDPVIVELAHIIRDFDGPCFVRPGFEPSTLKYTPGTPYISTYRRIVDMFRAEGVENAAYVWCCGPSGGPQMATEGMWFPGDAYVDWVGVDLFTTQSFEPAPGSSLPYADSLWYMLELADAWKKPVILSETSAVLPGGISDPSPGAGQAYWDAWFGPIFELIASEPRIKAFCYINWDWPAEGFMQWADAQIQNNPTLVGLIADELQHPRYLHAPTPGKFPRPWLTEAGQQTLVGGPGMVILENADPTPGSFMRFGFSLTKLVQPGTPGFLDNDYGVFLPGLDQPWFLGPLGVLTPPVPIPPDGRLPLPFSVPNDPMFAGLTYYIAAAVFDAGGGVSLTQPFELTIAP